MSAQRGGGGSRQDPELRSPEALSTSRPGPRASSSCSGLWGRRLAPTRYGDPEISESVGVPLAGVTKLGCTKQELIENPVRILTSAPQSGISKASRQEMGA